MTQLRSGLGSRRWRRWSVRRLRARIREPKELRQRNIELERELHRLKDAIGGHLPGECYSPIPSKPQWKAALQNANDRAVPGIALRGDHQLRRIDELAPLIEDSCLAENQREAIELGVRFHLDNDYFGRADAVLLQALMRDEPPGRIIEIGSGFSSALMLDTDDRYLGSTTKFTFIEPDTERVRTLLRDADYSGGRVQIINQRVQSVSTDTLVELEPGDILFVDSSHVVSTGSDVNHLLLQVVPMLPPGVRIQLHDVFWPFEYPEEWLQTGWYWSESYLLHALLINNDKLSIDLFPSYLFATQRLEVAQRVPSWRVAGSSVWLRTA